MAEFTADGVTGMAEANQQGEMLVKAGIITGQILERAVERQKESGRRLGLVLEEMGVITEQEWIDALAKQFGYKTVTNLTSYVYPPELLSLVPRDFAAQHAVFPLKQKEGMLAAAVTDPFDHETLDYLARKTGQKIIPFLARRADIAEAIRLNYFQGKSPAGGKQRILVVDDSQSITKIIQAALQQEGYEVSVGHDGLEGLKLALTDKPDLIITDTVMPRMDGYGLLRALKGNPATAQIPIILLTAKAGGEDEQRALEAGFLDFISKPVQPVRLLSRVKRAFELAQSMKK
jgi:CheY-like chemotaxis protein